MSILGRKVTDKITGFSGIVTGYVTYLTGCNQALVVPPVDEKGLMRDSQWLDEQRLTVADGEALSLDNARAPGFDRAPPKR